MSAPILATKLFMPRPRPQAVLRPRLIRRLNEGQGGGRALTLVSAPAGFGKTTLVGEWIEELRRKDPGLGIAWISLDEGDGDPSRFLLYFAAALQGIEPGCGIDASAALQSPRPPQLESILAELINEIEGMAKDLILVLDDYHAIDSPKVDALLAFLLEHPPARMRLVIATREDPNLPLARLRARGELCELRAVDLRFAGEEAADFLGRVMGLELGAEELSALESRTEGWIAGLQLAALSMRGQEDQAGFIRSFTGSHRFVLDYLAEEVLRRESEGIRDFLLRTSILDRLCGPLCDALMGGSSGQETLEYLDRANLFIVPLDGERRWYRYHRLFAELLRQRLEQSPAAVAELQVKASRWYEENGLFIEAFRHAAAAGDLDRAERLITSRGMPIHSREAVIPILDWLSSRPAAVQDRRPTLRLRFATMSLVAGRTNGVEEALDASASALSRAQDNEGNRDLLGQVAAARATLAVTRYRSDEILLQSRLALELLSPEDLGFRMTATWAASVAHFLMGDRTAVGRDFAELESMSRSVGDVFFTQLALCGLGETQEQDNALNQAAETFRRAIALFGDHPQPNANEAHLGLARILYEWNELDAAEAEGEIALRLARQYDESIDRFILCELLLARIKLARGLVAAAAARLEELAAKARSPGFLHRLPEIEELRVWALIRGGDIDGAAAGAGSHELPLARARLHLARNEASSALALLETRRSEMAARGWQDELLKTLVLQALAYRSGGQEDEALKLLDLAILMAEAGGFIRLFLDEAEPMERLLTEAAARRGTTAYVGKLLAAFAGERKTRAEVLPESAAPLAQALIDPLSERELEVLRLLAEGLSNQEIGERLFLALDTIKGHNRRIFDKLDAKRRTEAVARARELGLL
jgi:LuxR family transcriptional regulator, maltose regulon positive regulatory protein